MTDDTTRKDRPALTLTGTRNPSPGALHGGAVLEIQTRETQKLVYGRRPENGKPGWVGLLRFAALVRIAWAGAENDDPWADWRLCQLEEQLLQSREELTAMTRAMRNQLKGVRALRIDLAHALEPARIDLNFSTPYGFMAAYLLADHDEFVRAALTARHVGLVNRDTSARLLHEAGRSVRRAFQSALGYKFTGVTREDVRLGTAKAPRARELMGHLPQEVVDGEMRAEHAPALRARRPANGADEGKTAPAPTAAVAENAAVGEQAADVPAGAIR